MTTMIVDGFDHYGTGPAGNANMLDGPYGEVPQTVDPGATCGPGSPIWGARTGLASLGMNNNTIGNTAYRRALPTTQTALLLSMGFSISNLPLVPSDQAVCEFRDGGNNVFAGLWVTTSGGLELRGPARTTTPGNVLATTQGPVIVTQNWHFLEMKIDLASGTFILHVDDSTGTGTAVINATGLTFGVNPIGTTVATSPIAQFTLLTQFPTGAPTVTNAWVDDLVVRNTAGSVNNGFGGDTRVATMFPDANTATAGWLPNYRQNIGTGILDNRASNAMVTAATSTSTDLTNGDFTIEQFVRFEALPTGANQAVIFGKWDVVNVARSYQLYLAGPSLNSGQLCFQTSTDGTAGTVQTPLMYPWVPLLDTWYHVALVRTSGELLFFVNGSQLGLPIADSRSYYQGSAKTVLGGEFDNLAVANTYFDGFFDEVRLTVGFARYTAPFTPTTVPFPRSVIGGDAHFANVAWLSGFDSGVFDESGFLRTLTAQNGTLAITPDDGPAFGPFSTINKTVPQDDTFIQAPLLPATSILTLAAQPAANDTVSVGQKSGPVTAVYKFVSALTGAAYEVLIDSTIVLTLQNLFNAINGGPGIGTKYGTGTVANLQVNASQLPGDQLQVTANIPGTAGNSIVSTSSLTNGGGWTGTTLAGGANIPGPSTFGFQPPPPLTTVINSVCTAIRAFKTDAGTASVEASLIGPLGGVENGAAHALTVSPSYYEDIFETDPDTAGPITPTTLVGGGVRLTRTA